MKRTFSAKQKLLSVLLSGSLAIAGLGIGTFAVSSGDPVAPSVSLPGSQSDSTTAASSEDAPISQVDSSTEVPASSTEVPASSTEVPASSEVTSSSTEVPASSEVTSSSTEVPASSSEVTSSSTEVPASSSEVTSSSEVASSTPVSSSSSSSATPTDTQDVSLEGAKDVTVDDALLVQSGIYQRGTVLSFYAWNGKVTSGVASGFYYLPVSWKTNPSGSWTPKAPGEKYADSFDTSSMALGAHTLVVTYALTEYNATTSTWGTPDLSKTVTRSIDYTLVAASSSSESASTSSSSSAVSTAASSSSPAVSTAASSSKPAVSAAASTGNSNSIPATGDTTNLWLWLVVLLAAVAMAGVVLYRKQKGTNTH